MLENARPLESVASTHVVEQSRVMQRVVVVGVTGAGKTTFASTVSRRLGVPHIELDALYWGPKWTAVDTETLRARVALAVAGEAWIVDGNYSRVRDLTWAKADTLIWLDYSLPVVLSRLLRRVIRR